MAPRTRQILIRLSDREYAELTQAAALHRTKIATWARRSIMRRARRLLASTVPGGPPREASN